MDNIEKNTVFTQRTDFLWRSAAVYSIILLIYSVVRGSIENQEITLKLYDPIVLLLAVFIVFTFFSIFYRLYIDKTIILNEDRITLKNRLGRSDYSLNEIREIKISKKRIYNTKSTIRVIKLGIKNRKKYIKIRPAAYDKPQLLIDEIMIIKKRMN
jgi:hypothetical protein